MNSCSNPKDSKKKPLRPGSNPLSRAELDILCQQVIDLVGKKPEKAATILTEWVNQAEKGRKKAA